MALRRVIARRKRKAYQATWPINEAAARPPEGWPGWPDGKKFAFVITHDVEGPDGLAKCRQLMQLEKDLGYKSSFNFVPEGDYAVSRELRDELVENGFEVGVHDLHHDGHLYRSREIFSENAKLINHYLKEWNAAGFRAGFMLHNLEWLHDLNIAYDASTFDTDPFEPQPDGVNTIFPFWIPAPASNSDAKNGYVELPYTLVQDSTLFLSLQESTPEIWLKKLDWIAAHGGMALVNVHPDYLRFPGEPQSERTFPIDHYVRLLRHLKEKYSGVYWHLLPHELAKWYRQQILRPDAAIKDNEAAYQIRNTICGKRAAVVLYAPIASDARPRRELEALLDQGMSVDLICLSENNDPAEEIRGALRITRISIQHSRKGKGVYLWNYGYFFLRAFIILTLRSIKRRYDLVHVHNMPDVLVFTSLVPRLRGAKIILDLHDPMPELCETIFKVKPESRAVKLLKLLEKWSIKFAHLVLTPNESFRALFCARGCPPSKVQIIMNTPDEQIFKPVDSQSKSISSHSKKPEFKLMYHGLIAERHGLTTAIEAVAKLSADVPEIVLELFGESNDFLHETLNTAKKLGLNGRVRYHGIRSLDSIPAAITQVDIGIVPNRRTPFTEINFPTRIFEYLSMNKPVIAPDTKGIREYFDESEILYFKPDNADDLAKVIYWAYQNPEKTTSILKRGREVYQQYLWSQERYKFSKAVSSLFH